MSQKLLLWTSFFFYVVIRGGVSSGSVFLPEHACHSCANGSDSFVCRCDSMCGFYSDCCFDAPAASKHSFQSAVGFSCLLLPIGGGFYSIDNCPRSWNELDIVRNKCENKYDFSDALASIPVTDTRRNITYRNRYCAECNNVNPYDMSSFSLRLVCSELLNKVNSTYGNITADFLSRNMVFINYSWGVYHWNPDQGNMSFVHCWTSYELPTILLPRLRPCFSGAISTCAPDWNDALTEERCISSGMNIVYDMQGWSYRNLYCALCNNVQMNHTRCVPLEGGGVGGTTGKLPIFTVLLDIKPTNGNKFCPTNQIYDGYAKKCRTLFCTDSDKVARDGKCVKK